MRLPISIATALCSLSLSSALLASSSSGDSVYWYVEEEIAGYDSPTGLDGFGFSTALDGDTALIGQPFEAWGGEERGAAYVFVNTGSGWSQQARFAPSDLADEARFGYAVAVRGGTALVSATWDDDQGYHSGSAYVFTRSAGVWSQAAKIVPPDIGADDELGWSVAVGGNVALIGVPYANGATGVNQGSVYVYVDSGTGWTLHQKLEPSDPLHLGYFGQSVALTATTVLVGATRARGGGPLSTGAVYVFTKSGGTWQEETKFFASDGVSEDRFGYSIAFQGDRALVGAAHESLPRIGAAYVFERSGSSWTETQKLVASDGGSAANQFGRAVALDDTTAMVGTSSHYYGSDPGKVYVFELEGGSWMETDILTTPVSNEFGHGLALHGDRALIGDPYEWMPGKAYFFKRYPEPGFRFCFGDPGVDTPCPCDNDNDGSVPGSGCDNGIFASGAQLTAYGDPSVAADGVYLRTTNAEPTNSGIYFQGSQQVNGGAGVVFGDGLRCAGGQAVRLQVTFSDAEGTTRTTIPIAVQGGVSPGDTRSYQYWYRTTLNPPCGLWVNDFNLSNGYSITWAP